MARLPKRSAPPKDGEGTAQKRAKVADSETIMGDDEMKDHFKKDCIHKVPFTPYSISFNLKRTDFR